MVLDETTEIAGSIQSTYMQLIPDKIPDIIIIYVQAFFINYPL